MKWVEYHRPSWLVIENVSEFQQWGPVGDHGRPLTKFAGRFFQSWIKAIEAAGYRVDHRLLNAADFGAATSRTRLFVVARKGNRPVRWPEPSHAAQVGGELPGMEMKRWRAAAEIIDWSIPCRSVFLRKHPLKDNTLLRIEAGLRRFVEPFVVELRRNMSARGAGEPLSVITSGGRHHGVAVPFHYSTLSMGAPRGIGQPTPTFTANGSVHLAVPFIAGCGARDGQSPPKAIGEPLNTVTVKDAKCLAVPYLVPFFGERDGQQPRTHAIGDSLPSVTGHGAGGVALPFLSAFHNGADSERRNYPLDAPLPTQDTSNRYGLVAPYLVDVNHGEKNRSPGGRLHSIDEPLKTITASQRGQSIAVPFVVTYYANGRAYPVTDPLCTISTRDRCGLATAIIETVGEITPRTEGERRLLATMQELGVADVGFRMLANPELSLAQGFPADYIFAGNKGEVTKQIGNAVCPDVAHALTTCIAGAA